MKRLKLTGMACWTAWILGVLAVTGNAQAQQEQSKPNSGASGAAMDEMIVSTRKRDETLLDVPVSITAWGADEIDRSGAINLQDFSVRTPGFSYSDQAGQIPGRYNTALRFRGMDTNQSAPSQQIGTAFMDGVYIPTGVGSIGFEDVERIEIIRGPQSAVFGRSTFAGAVNYVTRKPGNEFAGRVSALLAGDETYDLSAAVEGPLITDKLAYRVTARGYGTGGQYSSATDGGSLGAEKTFALQGELAFTPVDSLELRFRTFFSKDSDGAPAAIFLGGAASNRGAGPNLHNCFSDGITVDDGKTTDFFCGELPKVNVDTFTNSNTTLDPFLLDQFTSDTAVDTLSGQERAKIKGVPGVTDVGLERDNLRLSMFMNWDIAGGFLQGATVSSITGYDKTDTNWIRDFEFTPAKNWLSQDPQSYEDFTQELRLTSNQDRRFRWSVGANYFNADFTRQGNGGHNIWSYDQALDFNGLNRVVFLSGAIPTEGAKTVGVFGFLSYDIVKNVALDFEWRWQTDEVTQNDPSTPGTDFSNDFNSFLPRVTATWKPFEATTIWLTYAEGNLPGFFNSDATGLSPTELQQIADVVGSAELFNKEEELKNYEMGWKQELLDGRLFFSAVGYFMEWTNLKTRQAIPIIRDTGEPFIANFQTNSGDANLWGVEFESTFQVTENLSGYFSFNWAQAEYQTFRCGFASFFPDPEKDCSGNTPPRYPDKTASLALTWTDQMTANWDYFTRVDANYVGKMYTEETNFAWVGKYSIVNLRGGFEKDNLRYELFVTNLFDDDNYTAAARWSDFSTTSLFGFVGPQGEVVTPPKKRQYGVKVVVKF